MSSVLYHVSDHVATLTLNRPEKRNALNAQMVQELHAAIIRAGKDPQVKVIVLTGSGQAFCAGADLAYLQQLQHQNLAENVVDSKALMELFREIYMLGKVVIAKIQGDAIAGGCGLATVADFSFSVEQARFGYTEVRIGFVPAIVSVFLVRKIGEGKAKELLLTGQLFSATKAQQYGLINKVCSVETLDQEVHELVKHLCEETSGFALGQTKALVQNAFDGHLTQALENAAMINASARQHADCKKGIEAFLNKTKPQWI
jgi:methylglutaconyl-CoA hydratase